MLFSIENKNGAKATFSSLGARIVSLFIPDATGNLVDVVQGFDTEEEYKTKGKSQGAICGRFANRIANAQFSIGEDTYILPANNGNHCLHGGNHELRLAEFKGESFGKQAHFVYNSPDLERGFPGNLTVEITYTLTDENVLKIQLQAQTDKTTPVNLTSHPYFNLNGAGYSKILQHQLIIHAEKLVEVDAESIPTGQLIDVVNTAFDFQAPITVGDNMGKGHQLIDLVNGFDHCYAINNYEKGTLKEDAVLIGDQSGLKMTISSTYPGLQLYTANDLNTKGKLGKHYGSHSAICLEPQFFPDSPNRPNFPFDFLNPKEKYNHEIIFKFEHA